MAGPAFFRNPAIQSLRSILQEIHNGELLVPRFQRPFVWTDEQRLELLDSIYHGFPIGSVLVWRTREYAERVKTYDRIGPFQVQRAEAKGQVRQFLLDGHQRLTTLYASIGVGLILREDGEIPEVDLDEIRWPIYFDLESEEFVFKNRRANPPPTWLNLTKLYDNQSLFEFQRQLGKRRTLSNRAEDLATRFKEYPLPVIPMASEDLDQVTSSFKRINSQGTSMSSVHMVAALIYSPGFDFRDAIASIRENLNGVGWGSFEEKLILYTMKLLLGLRIYKDDAEATVRGLSEDKSKVEETEEAVFSVADFLKRTCNILSPQTLPYSFQAVHLAKALYEVGQPSAEAEELLAKWLWVTTYTEHFAGISETRHHRTLDHLITIARGEEGRPLPNDPEGTVEPLDRFDYRSARSRAVALCIARTHDDVVGELEAHQLLADLGNDATVYPFSTPTYGNTPENRFIVAPRDREVFLKRLVENHASLDEKDPTFRARHLIPPDFEWSSREPAPVEIKEFLAERRKLILRRESAWIERFGLTPSDAYDV